MAVARYSMLGIICSGAVSVRALRQRKPRGLLPPFMAPSRNVISSGQPPVALQKQFGITTGHFS